MVRADTRHLMGGQFPGTCLANYKLLIVDFHAGSALVEVVLSLRR